MARATAIWLFAESGLGRPFTQMELVKLQFGCMGRTVSMPTVLMPGVCCSLSSSGT